MRDMTSEEIERVAREKGVTTIDLAICEEGIDHAARDDERGHRRVRLAKEAAVNSKGASELRGATPPLRLPRPLPTGVAGLTAPQDCASEAGGSTTSGAPGAPDTRFLAPAEPALEGAESAAR